MPKLKTHSGTKDRVRMTKNGKAITGHAFGNHLLSNKSASRKRRISSTTSLVGKALKTVKKNLGA